MKIAKSPFTIPSLGKLAGLHSNKQNILYNSNASKHFLHETSQVEGQPSCEWIWSSTDDPDDVDVGDCRDRKSACGQNRAAALCVECELCAVRGGA